MLLHHGTNVQHISSRLDDNRSIRIAPTITTTTTTATIRAILNRIHLVLLPIDWTSE
jgi:hypothetical protein